VPRLCLPVDTTRTDHHPNNPSHPTPRARDLRERLDSAADEGLSRRRLDDGTFRRFVDDVKARTDLVALIGRDLDQGVVPKLTLTHGAASVRASA
jgi:hypothetical protein